MFASRFASKAAAIIATGALILSSAADACTGIRLTAADGTVVHARTLEFAIDLHSDVLVSPRGFKRVGLTPDGQDGLTWKAKYASVGANGVGLPIIIDGVNEAGLAAGLFYFPTTAGYPDYTPADAAKTIAPWQLGSWILDNFASVDEVKANIGSILVAATVLKQWGFSPPVHAIVHDASGKSIVIEYVGGKLNVYDNPLGVITNSPGFDWHMTNLRNYVNFSLDNHPPIKLGSVKLEPFGQGSGMLGMPGDFTPPSRFVRAVAFSQSVLEPKTGDEAVLTAFHILNNFDIPKGSAREAEKDEHGNILADYTLWTAASDLKTKRYYFRTYEDSRIRMVDLMKMDLNAKDLVAFSMHGEEAIQQLNP
ncbi:MAG TPA: choloylglycine hydrolase family protein [Roseiarcus sp.]|jgi:choloylglycine hydrolase